VVPWGSWSMEENVPDCYSEGVSLKSVGIPSVHVQLRFQGCGLDLYLGGNGWRCLQSSVVW